MAHSTSGRNLAAVAVSVEDSPLGEFSYHVTCVPKIPHNTIIVHPLPDIEGSCDLSNCPGRFES